MYGEMMEEKTERPWGKLFIFVAALLIVGIGCLFVIGPKNKDYNKPRFNAYNSTSLVCVEWLKNNAKDKSSLEIISCSVPEKITEANWEQIIKYRAKNSFGGHVIESRFFIFTKDEVISNKVVTWNK